MNQKFTNRFFRLLLLLLTMIFAADGFGQIYYVRPSGNDGNMGTSWATPFKSIQRALAAATVPGTRIFVERGTYFVDEGFQAIDNIRTSTITLKNGVSLYGGFDPDFGIDDLNDVRTSKSRLSGDLAQNDFGADPGLQDNAFHVVTSTSVAETTVFDGFIISDGNANGGGTFDLGGGMLSNSTGLIISNCDFMDNYAISGAGIANFNAPVTLNNCSFTRNTATNGGAIFNNASSPKLNNCNLFNNVATNYGGAIYNTESSPIITNTSISGNSAGIGGAVSNRVLSNPSFINSVFQANAAVNTGGAVDNDQSNPGFINCTITANSGATGGAVANNNANPVITNCILWNNTATGFPEISNGLNSTPTITYSIVKGGQAGTGNLDLDPLFGDNSLNLTACSPAIDAGSNAAVPAAVLTDINGNARKTNSIVDMGALEYNLTSPVTYYRDSDGDTYGNPSNAKGFYCSTIPSGWVANNGDCDDANSGVRPGIEDICYNGIDDDCNGFIDDNDNCGGGVGCENNETYYRDSDGDGYGDAGDIIVHTTCDIGYYPGYVLNGDDCDDSDFFVNPGAQEICDNYIDDNCDGQVDEDCGGTVCQDSNIYYYDGDGDGYGNPGNIYNGPVCVALGMEWVANGGDCNDAVAAINPGAAEICGNGIDDNCNGLVDENCDPCGVFSNLTTTNISSTSATLNWVASTNPDQWQVQYKSTSKGSKWIDVPNVGPADRSVTITNLNSNQDYIWHIRAKCGKVMTKYSSSIEFRTAQNSNTSAALAVNTQKEQVARASALVVYPSPASHQFSIRLNLGTAVAAPVAIQLFDMNGKMVLNQNAGLVSGLLQKQLTLPSSLSNGLYLVRITADGKVFNRKLIVNK